jgi:hypothetical protein
MFCSPAHDTQLESGRGERSEEVGGVREWELHRSF